MKQFYNVEMICTVRKLVTVECDNEQTAKNDPWEYATDEMEIDQINWEVVGVEKV